MGLEETKPDNEIAIDPEEKEVKSKATLEVVLPAISQTNSYAFRCPNLAVM